MPVLYVYEQEFDINVPADGLAPNGTGPPTGKVLITKIGPDSFRCVVVNGFKYVCFDRMIIIKMCDEMSPNIADLRELENVLDWVRLNYSVESFTIEAIILLSFGGDIWIPKHLLKTSL